MGLLERVTIKVSSQAYQRATCGKRVYGQLGSSPNVWVRALLGEEVEDLTCHEDEKTEYRKFLGCKVEFAESFELLREGNVIQGASLYDKTISIFC